MLAWAEWYAKAHGWEVMPGYIDLRTKGKKPVGTWDLMTKDTKELEAFGGAWKGGLIMTLVGEKFVSLDIDNKHGKSGDADLAALEDQHGALRNTPTWQTPSGGRQMLFAYPGDHVQKSVSKLGVRPGQAQSGLDVLVGKSSLVVLPGSRRPDGDVVWLEGRRSDQLPFAPIPDWLLQLMIAASSPKRPAAEAAGSASRSSATDEVREAVAQVLEGDGA